MPDDWIVPSGKVCGKRNIFVCVINCQITYMDDIEKSYIYLNRKSIISVCLIRKNREIDWNSSLTQKNADNIQKYRIPTKSI